MQLYLTIVRLSKRQRDDLVAVAAWAVVPSVAVRLGDVIRPELEP